MLKAVRHSGINAFSIQHSAFNIQHSAFSIHSELAVASFPPAAKGNPERRRDQPHVQPEALSLDVQPVVPEFLAARNIARGVDLRDAGEARADTAPMLVTWHFFELLE